MPSFPGLVDHRRPEPYPFGPTSVADILDAGLAEHPDRIALIDGDDSWTWSEVDTAVSLVAAGIEPGQLMWWALGNCAEQVIGMLATFRAAGVWIAASPKDAASRLPAMIERLGPVTLIRSVKESDALVAGIHHTTEESSIDPAAPAVVMFTSGTTGNPKAVVHSQHNVLGPGLLSIELEPPAPGERIGTALDLANANIAMLGPISALLRGSTFVVMKRTFAAGLAADVANFGVTRLFAVPTMIHDLVEQPVERDSFSTLDRIILGGGTAAPDVHSHFFNRYGVRPTLSYGMSEAPTGVVRESLDDSIGSGRGFPLPHVDVSILDSAGSTLEQGVVGEICLRRARSGRWANTWTGTLGYVGEPERTAELFRGGVLHTGDLGRLDADGALAVTGRLSDLIIRGGMNIDPVELEQKLVATDAVREALVVGIPDARLGQLVGALIVLDETLFACADSLDLVELAMDLEEMSSVRLDAVAAVGSLPRNAMGKVIRVAPPDVFGPDTRLG
ncbi:MAG: long-chain acyl-CoA synthetase [Verrucomicrobiales bacterium]|jgi:long-chain acyl-CoA synthetase